MEPNVLRVRGGRHDDSVLPTDPIALSKSVLNALQNNPDNYVELTSVGQNALHIAMKAFRVASKTFSERTNGFVLVCRQSEYKAIVNENETKGICTRIFPIPTRDAI